MKDRGRSALSERERKRIKQAIDGIGISMQALSLRLGYHRGAVEQVVNGGSTPSIYMLADIYRYLGLDYIDLRDDEADEA